MRPFSFVCSLITFMVIKTSIFRVTRVLEFSKCVNPYLKNHISLNWSLLYSAQKLVTVHWGSTSDGIFTFPYIPSARRVSISV